MKGYCLFCLYW